MKKILISTHSKGKLEEYKTYLQPTHYSIVGLNEIGVNDVSPENGNSYLEVAQNKALFYSQFSKLPIIAEDSGLEILSWKNFPGIRSHTWMEGTDEQRNREILKKMEGVADRRAVFKVAIVYMYKKRFVNFSGQMRGKIAKESEGVMGFGYDPIFYVPELKRTLAKITHFEKNKISHRGQAMQKLVSYLNKYKPE